MQPPEFIEAQNLTPIIPPAALKTSTPSAPSTTTTEPKTSTPTPDPKDPKKPTAENPKTPTDPDPLRYYYIKPTFSTPNVILILLVIIGFCYLIISWNYTSTNWDNVKCNNSNFYIAPLFGQDSTATLQQCTMDIANNAVTNSATNLNFQKQITDLSNNMTNLNDALHSTALDSVKQTGNTINAASNILTGIQQNIDNIKNTITKVLGSVIVSSYMSDGIIQSTQNLENTNLVNTMSQYNAAGATLSSTNTNAASMPTV